MPKLLLLASSMVCQLLRAVAAAGAGLASQLSPRAVHLLVVDPWECSSGDFRAFGSQLVALVAVSGRGGAARVICAPRSLAEALKCMTEHLDRHRNSWRAEFTQTGP